MSVDETPPGNERGDPLTAEILREVRHVRRSQDEMRTEFRTDIKTLQVELGNVRQSMARGEAPIDAAKTMAKEWPVVVDRVNLHHSTLIWAARIIGAGLLLTIGGVIIWAIGKGFAS